MRESEERQRRIDEAIRMLEEHKQVHQIFLKMEEKKKQDHARNLREEVEERRRQLEEDIKARRNKARRCLEHRSKKRSELIENNGGETRIQRNIAENATKEEEELDKQVG